jgi:hypothetical protein
MENEYGIYVEASIHGYHAYFQTSTVYIGEILACEVEPDNEYDKYAVVVKNEDGYTVGHVPIKLSKTFHKFLVDYGELEVECIGSKYNEGEGKGLEIPVDYKLIGNAGYLEQLLQKLKKTEISSNWKLTDVIKLS